MYSNETDLIIIFAINFINVSLFQKVQFFNLHAYIFFVVLGILTISTYLYSNYFTIDYIHACTCT